MTCFLVAAVMIGITNSAFCQQKAFTPAKLVQLTGNEETDLLEQQDISSPNIAKLVHVDTIEISVSDREIKITQNISGNKITKKYPAGTAQRGKEYGLPFEKKGNITKIVFNPTWTPTKNIRKESLEKFNVTLPKVFPPGPNNPLGKIKLFVTYKNGPNDLGIHGTSEPKSIGKRASHGCNRMADQDIVELASVILAQSGHNPQELLKQAQENPKRTIVVNIKNGPEVYYRK